MDELTKLAVKHGTDKWGKHAYTPVYYEMFKDRRNEVKKVLEIGVAEGAGLRMFRDFFPNAQVFGAELEDGRIIEEERIKVFKCNQGFDEDLRNLIRQIGRDLDLVVDDGSHWPTHQTFTCLTLMPLLKHGVTYIIEDVAKPEIIKELSQYDTELIKCGDRYDDKLIVIKHK